MFEYAFMHSNWNLPPQILFQCAYSTLLPDARAIACSYCWLGSHHRKVPPHFQWGRPMPWRVQDGSIIILVFFMAYRATTARMTRDVNRSAFHGILAYRCPACCHHCVAAKQDYVIQAIGYSIFQVRIIRGRNFVLHYIGLEIAAFLTFVQKIF